jgi:hypothetical protein
MGLLVPPRPCLILIGIVSLSSGPLRPLPADDKVPAINDLWAAAPRSSSIVLRWTSPAGRPPGAARYDLRCSTRRMNESTWDAPEVVKLPLDRPPAAPGTREELVVEKLAPDTAYRFAMKLRVGESWSPLSNVAREATLRPMSGHDIYVSPSGSDAGDGSRERPYQTLHKGCAMCAAGDTVRALAGIYRRDHFSPRTGTAVVSEDGPGKAVVDGEGHTQHLVSIWGKDDVVVDGFELRNAGGNHKDANDVIWIDGKGKGVGAHRITLRHLFVHHAGEKGDCIKVTNHVFDFVLEGSRLTWGWNASKGENEELLDMKLTVGAVIRDNWFYHLPDSYEGAMAYSKTDSRNIVFEGNIFGPQSTRATDSALGAGWSSSSVGPNTEGLLIRGNLFIDCGFSPVGAYGVKDERILENVFFNCARRDGGMLHVQEGGSQKKSQEVSFVNNIVIDSDGKLTPPIYFRQSLSPLVNFEHHHNLFWNAGKPIPAAGEADPNREEGFLNADPLLRGPFLARPGEDDHDAVLERFSPRPGSPAQKYGFHPAGG